MNILRLTTFPATPTMPRPIVIIPLPRRIAARTRRLGRVRNGPICVRLPTKRVQCSQCSCACINLRPRLQTMSIQRQVDRIWPMVMRHQCCQVFRHRRARRSNRRTLFSIWYNRRTRVSIWCPLQRLGWRFGWRLGSCRWWRLEGHRRRIVARSFQLRRLGWWRLFWK